MKQRGAAKKGEGDVRECERGRGESDAGEVAASGGGRKSEGCKQTSWWDGTSREHSPCLARCLLASSLGQELVRGRNFSVFSRRSCSFDDDGLATTSNRSRLRPLIGACSREGEEELGIGFSDWSWRSKRVAGEKSAQETLQRRRLRWRSSYRRL